MSPLPVISLFSGCGGLDLGVVTCMQPPAWQLPSIYQDDPYEIAVATDYDESSLRVLSKNSPEVATITEDIREVTSRALLDAAGLDVGDAALVVGGPPCTPFSKSGFWIDEKRESRDPNASLLDEFVRVVADTRPEGFILENVQGLTYRTHARQFQRLLSGLRDAGYSVDWKVLLAADYGVPQLRRRVFVLGRRDGGRIDFPHATHSGWSERDRSIDDSLKPYVTAREALAGLNALPEPDEIVEGQWADAAASIPPGENYLFHTERGGGDNIWKWRSRYWTFLLRLDPSRPATTIQAQPGPWVGPFHWENMETEAGPRARRLRVPEILRLFGYPDDFITDQDRREAQRQLGNSVPIGLGRVVARTHAAALGHIDGLSLEGEPVQASVA